MAPCRPLSCALIAASASGHLGVVWKLLAHGSEIDVKGKVFVSAPRAALSPGTKQLDC